MNITVNGVIAGCRPEYMPVLVALVEAMADPKFGQEHLGHISVAITRDIYSHVLPGLQESAARRFERSWQPSSPDTEAAEVG
ncbi:hypothetical protein ACFLVW_00695 [Chloroflexota bacterium]